MHQIGYIFSWIEDQAFAVKTEAEAGLGRAMQASEKASGTRGQLKGPRLLGHLHGESKTALGFSLDRVGDHVVDTRPGIGRKSRPRCKP